MWVDSQGEGPAQKKGKLKAISTWDGMKKVAKILNFHYQKQERWRLMELILM